MTRTPVFLLCLLCKEMVKSSHIPCNYNNDIQIFRYFPKKKGSHPHPYIKLLFASATTFPQKIIISSLLLCLPNPPKKTHLEYSRSTLPPSPDRIFSVPRLCVAHVFSAFLPLSFWHRPIFYPFLSIYTVYPNIYY